MNKSHIGASDGDVTVGGVDVCSVLDEIVRDLRQLILIPDG